MFINFTFLKQKNFRVLIHAFVTNIFLVITIYIETTTVFNHFK